MEEIKMIETHLKTRPSHKWMVNNLDKIEDVEIWFKKFEKEIRAELTEAIKTRDKSVSDGAWAWWDMRVNTLRMVLGECPSQLKKDSQK